MKFENGSKFCSSIHDASVSNFGTFLVIIDIDQMNSADYYLLNPSNKALTDEYFIIMQYKQNNLIRQIYISVYEKTSIVKILRLW